MEIVSNFLPQLTDLNAATVSLIDSSIQSRPKNIWCCIASGPSLTQEDCDAVRRAGIPTIAVNNNYQRAPWANVLYACDKTWWDAHWLDVKKRFAGEKVTQNKPAADTYGIRYIESVNGQGLEKNRLVQGQNGGYQAINLAYVLGAQTVILLGYDMQNTEGKSHWHGDHAKPLSNAPNYSNYIKSYRRMHPEQYGLTVINCSRQTALTCFKRQDLGQFLDSIWKGRNEQQIPA